MEDYIEFPYRNKVQFPISTECDSINITFNHSCNMFIILGSGKWVQLSTFLEVLQRNTLGRKNPP